MLWMSLFILLTLCLILPVAYWYYLLFKFRSLDKIPGPKPFPLLGNKFSADPHESFEHLKGLKRKYGEIFKVWTGTYLHVMMTTPRHFEAVLSSNEHITKGVAYDLVKPWLGDGLLVSRGDKWRRHRKIITPTFHFKILEEFMKTFNRTTNILLKKMEALADKPEVNIHELMSLLSLDVVCETSMGTTVNAQDDKSHYYVVSTKSLLNIFGERLFASWKQIEFLYQKFSEQGEYYLKCMKVTREFCENVIKNRKEQIWEEIKNAKPDSDNELIIKKRFALLDTLLNHDHILTDEDIRSEIDTFMFEGHDTTSTAISYVLYELAKNPEIQQKLYEEIVAHFGTETRDVTITEINELKYLHMVIKESQRINPTVPFIERQLTSDLEIDGTVFPKGCMLSMMIYFLHQDEKIYPEPHKFDPDRFLPENCERRHNYAYLPFSAGPRNCIGQRFAMLIVKTAIIKVFQKFIILPVPGHVLKQGMTGTLRSYSGINIQIKKRN